MTKRQQQIVNSTSFQYVVTGQVIDQSQLWILGSFEQPNIARDFKSNSNKFHKCNVQPFC
jgi:hypothetical protein